MWSSTLLMSSLLYCNYGGDSSVLIRSCCVELTCGKSRIVCKSWPEPRDDAIEVCEHQRTSASSVHSIYRMSTADCGDRYGGKLSIG